MSRTLPSTICMAPFTGMRQDAYGSMSPCPFGAGEWKLQGLSTKEKFFSEPWNKLREKFLAGEKPVECSRCWNEEDAGKKSMRQIYLEERRDSLELVTSGAWKNGPVSVTLKTSNVCNLSCKTCSGGESSKFRLEGEHLIEKYGADRSMYVVYNPPTHVSIEDALGYAEFSENLKYLEFFGGEPLLNKTHVSMMEDIIKKGKARDISLYYSTNATNFPADALIEIWSHFKSVKLGLSIDGIGKGFTYMRWPGNFEAMSANIDRYQSEVRPRLAAKDTAFDMVGSMTVSSLNIYNTDECYSWLMEKLKTGCYASLVQGPSYQAVINLPERVKAQVTVKLESSPNREVFRNLINFMNSRPCDLNEWKKFVIVTERQDRFRKLTMAEAFPEYWEIIKEDYLKFAGDLSEASYHSPV